MLLLLLLFIIKFSKLLLFTIVIECCELSTLFFSLSTLAVSSVLTTLLANKEGPSILLDGTAGGSGNVGV